MSDFFEPTPPSTLGERLRATQDWSDALSKMRYTTIKGIVLPDEVRRGVEGFIDPGIADLVRVINPLGLRTEGSCEGHLDGRRHPFPWVTVYGLGTSQEMRVDVQQRLLDGFNQKSNIVWITAGGLVQPEQIATTTGELMKLQASAQELAEYVFKRHLRGRRIRYTRMFHSPFVYRMP